MVPEWRYNAPATLDFGGAWVIAGTGRDPTSADLTVALDGFAVPSSEVALSQHPDQEGVYTLVFSAAYWARAQATNSPTVSFPAGAFVSPTYGPLGAFSEHVALVDCMLPMLARAILLQIHTYTCSLGAITCPADGLWRAAFVLQMDFSEPVFGPDGGTVTDANVDIYTVGGVATVVGMYVVQLIDTQRRRLSEAGTMQLSVAVELSAGATGSEVIKVRPRHPGAIQDGTGRWYLSHQDADVVTAAGNVLKPFATSLSISLAGESVSVAVGVPVGVFVGVSLLVAIVCLCERTHRNIAQARVAPRSWGSWGSWTGDTNTEGSPGAPKTHQKKSRGKPASADALVIAKHYKWLRTKETHIELTGRWIDTLADATVNTLNGVQPACALVPGVLQTAHVVHSNLQGGGRHAQDDLEALRTLGKLLRKGPPALPESLLMAAASLDMSAMAAMGTFGEAEATRTLQLVRDPTFILSLSNYPPPPAHHPHCVYG